ncbi:unnamed protein product [Mytilus coruscus]|uniref:Uncharacterized protein n=1 Tax=Mytilus coruscus TaxID=42192 RepID=A0A6J8EKD1_MYTCO|nr:unnamed protein product [Mytilus coruscus]
MAGGAPYFLQLKDDYAQGYRQERKDEARKSRRTRQIRPGAENMERNKSLEQQKCIEDLKLQLKNQQIIESERDQFKQELEHICQQKEESASPINVQEYVNQIQELQDQRLGNLQYENVMDASESLFSLIFHLLTILSTKFSELYGDVTSNVQKLDEFINQSATRIGNFFTTYFDFKFKLPQDQCPVKINISCLVGSTLIPILTSEVTNCSENRDLITFIQHSLTVPIFCSILTCMYFVLLTWSVCRNRKKIYTTCYSLSERSLLQRRRPILAVILTLGSIYLAGHTEYISFKQFLQDSDDVENDTVKPIGLCVSNPDTISIREGFRNSTKRFVKKVKREKKHKDNSVEQMRLNERSEADQSTGECHQYTEDVFCC